MNKKASTFGFWVEVVIFLALFLVVIGIVGTDMNNKYNKNYDLTMGLNLSSQTSALQQYQTDIVNGTSSGQASLTDFGVIKLLTIPSMIYQVTSILWTFVSGTFIYTLVNNMQLGTYGSYIAGFFQTLYVIAIGFILIKLILRINV